MAQVEGGSLRATGAPGKRGVICAPKVRTILDFTGAYTSCGPSGREPGRWYLPRVSVARGLASFTLGYILFSALRASEYFQQPVRDRQIEATLARHRFQRQSPLFLSSGKAGAILPSRGKARADEGPARTRGRD